MMIPDEKGRVENLNIKIEVEWRRKGERKPGKIHQWKNACDKTTNVI
jgi:hypothetical protein